MMARNSTNINKTNNCLQPQIIEYRKRRDIWRWKSRPWLETGTQMWRGYTS